VFGNFALQVLFTLPGAGRYMRAIGRRQAALPITIAVRTRRRCTPCS